jgi:aminoglycoside phosphotransferase (APT) family kinase protein
MRLPPFPDLQPATLRQIAARHGIPDRNIGRMPEVGIFNALYSIDDRYVLRVPRQQKAFIAALRKETLVVPAARAAGVRTPELLVFDDKLDLVQVPYAIYAGVPGRTFGLLEIDHPVETMVWRELGHDIALLHQGVANDNPIGRLALEELPDPRELPRLLADLGYFSKNEARWLRDWLEVLAPAALGKNPRCLLHGDLQATNIIVDTDPYEYVALLDWGAAGWGDPAWDFAGMPLRAVPAILQGYDAVAPIGNPESFAARILWRQLQMALFLLQREPQPNRSWAERPLGALLDIMRFMSSDPGEPWQRLRI